MSINLSQDSEKAIQEDAAHLLEAYKEAYTEVFKDFQKPNVLITGITGSGKSSFVNALFHSNIAPVGSGSPITQHFDRYAPEEIPIVVYDSKGLENGKADEFISSTKEFFKNHPQGDIQNSVHVVWYIVNSAMARFQDFEKMICTDLFCDVPIIFVLNKADLSTEEERQSIRDAVKGMKLKNCYGVFDTVSVPGQKQTIIDVDECPVCQSEDLVISTKKRLLRCENCGTTKSIQRRNGLSDVIKATLGLLPVLARDAFVASQKVSTHANEEQAKRAIMEQAAAIDKAHARGVLMKETAIMLTRLSIIWQFREHGDMYGKEVVKHLGDTLSLRDSVMLILHQNKAPKSRAISLGLVWNHCVRALAMELFRDTIEIENEEDLNELKTKWPDHIHAAFEFLSLESVEKYEKSLQKRTLKEVLDEEMPPEPEHVDEIVTHEEGSANKLRREKTTTALSESKPKTSALRTSQSATALNTHHSHHGNGKGKKKGHKSKSPATNSKGSPKIEEKSTSSKSDRKKNPPQKTPSEPSHMKSSTPPAHKKDSHGDESSHSDSKLRKSKKANDDEEKHEIVVGKHTGSKRKKSHAKERESEEDSSG